MTLSDARARLRRGFARIWAKVKKVFHVNRGGWGSEPAQPGQQFYRTQYERMVDLLPTLPRTAGNETSGAFLAFSQVVQQLHEMGDDPINPPGVTRVVRPDDRLASFGAVGQASSFVGSFTGPSGWIMAALAAAAVTGWGGTALQGARLEVEQAKHARTKDEYAMVVRSNEHLRETMVDLTEMVRNADAQSQQTAETVEAERARRVRAEAELRRVRNAYEQARAGGDVDYGFGGVRDAGPGAN